MRIRFVLTLLLLPVFFIVGCNINGGEIPRYDSDIVYQTMSEKKKLWDFIQYLQNPQFSSIQTNH